MNTRKVLRGFGFLLFGMVVLAIGYWWGQNQKRIDPDSPSPQQAQAMDNMEGMQASDSPEMKSGTVNVSPEKQQLMGIRTAVAEIRPLVKRIRTVGIVTYDETKVAQVFTKVEGWIEKLFVNYTGKLVERGQPLFTLYSPELVSTQEEYLLALQAEKAFGSSQLQEIRKGSASLLEATRRRLRLWDISAEEIEELEQTGQPKKNLTIHSPLNGFVIKKDAFQGMKVMPDKELYTITDLSNVWVNADIYEFELPYVRVDQRATITLSYFPGQTFAGRVSWISPILDEKTRTAKLRLEVANHDFKLKPEMYANVEIGVDAGKKLAIPDEAVLDSGLRKVVFLDKGEGRFEPAEIKTGGKFDGYYEVLAGLSHGERILASAGFLLDSESRLKEAMGAMAGMAGMEKEGTQGKDGMKGMKMDAPVKGGPQEKKIQDLTLTLSTQAERPKAGENIVRLKIADKAGKPVKDAQVSFIFQMTMAGMAPSNADGKLSRDGFYEAKAGENIVRLKITDNAGKIVKDAQVSFTFQMTMAGMAPSNADGKLSRNGFYEAKANLAMAGEWETTVAIRRPGQKEIQEKFKLIAQQ